MNTATLPTTDASIFNRTTYTSSGMDFGKTIARLLQRAFPENTPSIETAGATCVFAFQGPHSVGTEESGKNWGYWIRTRIQSWNKPCGDCIWQDRPSGWFVGDSQENANAILACFNLSVNDVYSEWGKPGDGELYYLTLQQIVETLRPSINVDETIKLISGMF